MVTRGVGPIIVVNDGSGPDYNDVFRDVAIIPDVILLNHATNLGKGAALKTGLNHAAYHFPDHIGVVTADADGQHLTQDILRVAECLQHKPDSLVLGSRKFDRDVPLRSKFGNTVTRHALRMVLGYALRDTQTGLRGIPRNIALQTLKLNSRGYEFELDMLILCRKMQVAVIETDIQTVYLDGNKSSHFNPLLDSMRIYFTMLRFLFASASAAVVDNLLFVMLFAVVSRHADRPLAILISQVLGRFLALFYNYATIKRLVFDSRQSHIRVIPKFLLHVTLACAVSYSMITLMVERSGMNVVLAKILAESLLFIPNFAIQRDFVFNSRSLREVITDDE